MSWEIYFVHVDNLWELGNLFQRRIDYSFPSSKNSWPKRLESSEVLIFLKIFQPTQAFAVDSTKFCGEKKILDPKFSAANVFKPPPPLRKKLKKVLQCGVNYFVQISWRFIWESSKNISKLSAGQTGAWKWFQSGIISTLLDFKTFLVVEHFSFPFANS